MHLFDLKRVKWPPRNQNHVHLHLPLLFRRILPNPRSHSNLSKAHPEHWYRNIHEKNVDKIGGSHMGGNYLRSASLRANSLLPTAPTRKSRRHRRVALELLKCIPRFNKNYIVPVEPAFRLWMRVGRSISNTPRILQISPEPGFPFCCIWSAHTGVTLLNCPSQNAGDGRCAQWLPQEVLFLEKHGKTTGQGRICYKEHTVAHQFHLRHLMHSVQDYNLGNVWKCTTKKVG